MEGVDEVDGGDVKSPFEEYARAGWGGWTGEVIV
jgi:hypothetical protein